MIPQLQPIAATVRWAGRNFAHNLQFIPQDRLHWRPGPEASSALEVTAHVLLVTRGVQSAFSGGEYHFEGEAIQALARELELGSAMARIVETTESYAQLLERLEPQDLEGEFTLPGGHAFSRRRLANLPALDLMHHHGQLAYIQLLLGDTESHFVDMEI